MPFRVQNLAGQDCSCRGHRVRPFFWNPPERPHAAKSYMSIDLKIDALGNDPPPSMHFEVTLPADVAAISPVVGWVMRLVGELEFAVGKEFEIEMALREALANAILHGCKADPSKKIDFSVTGDRLQGIMIVVRDPGGG